MTHAPAPHAVEPIRWRCHTRLEKFRVDPITGKPVPGSAPYETVSVDGNLLMYGGASALWDRLINSSPTVTEFDSSNAYIGVGDDDTAEAATQTDLQASTNVHREIVDAAPTHTDGTTSGSATVSFVATFETGDANFAWNEWGLFNASSSGRMLNRKVQSLGTKTSSDEWVFTITLTLA